MSGRPLARQRREIQEQIDRGELPPDYPMPTAPGRPEWVPVEVIDHSGESAEEGNDRRIAELSALLDKTAAALDRAIDQGNASLIKSLAQALALTTDRYRVTAGLAVTRSEAKNLQLTGRLKPEDMLAHAERLQNVLKVQLDQRTSRAIEASSDDA